MAGIQIEVQPVCEPVSLADAKSYLHIASVAEDTLIQNLIRAARGYCETFTRRSFINKGYIEVLDSFPYYTDTLQSQQAYPPAYYSLPRYSTTLWNYSQMMKVYYSRLRSVSALKYIGTDGVQHTLVVTTDPENESADAWIDTVSEPGRIFPKAGAYWPACLYHGNAVEIHFVSGCNDDAAIAAALNTWKQNQSPAPTQDEINAQEAVLRQADVPAEAVVAILQLVAHWFDNRWGVMAENLKQVPKGIDNLLWSLRVLDVAPTRG